MLSTLPGDRNGGPSSSRGLIKCLFRQPHCLAYPLPRERQNILISSVLMCERDSLLWEAHEQNDQGHVLAFRRWALKMWLAGSIPTNVRSLRDESMVGNSLEIE